MSLDFNQLEEAAQKEIDDGLSACQVSVAQGGKVVFTRALGSASATTRFWIASATKPIVSSAALHLIAEGKLDVERPVSHYLPEFAANGKQDVTVEQVMVMTSGFPNAPMKNADINHPERRRAQIAAWELESEPGSRYVYHGRSAHLVIAELIERISGRNFRDFVEDTVTTPLGLPRALGIAREDQTDVAQLSESAPEATRSLYAYADKIEAGEPGGGAIMTADQLALFYQGLLHNPGKLWDPAVLADGLFNIRCTLPDPLMKLPANRSLTVVVGAGFGATWSDSDTAFGWPGAGGQVGFAEPTSGLSFAFLQMGDVDQVTQFVRGVKMSKLALQLGD